MKALKKNSTNRILSAALLFVMLFMLFLSASFSSVDVQAAGLVDETVDVLNLYSKYPWLNYQLDFYMDTTWDFLPWKWLEAVGSAVYYAFHSMANGIWSMNVVFGSATGYVVQEAYTLDFIGDMAENIGKNIQTLAGVSKSGIAREGFYPGFLKWIILAVGAYVAYMGLVKREMSKAVEAVVSMVIIFLLSAAFIVYAPDYIKNINEFSSDISTETLNLGTKLILSEDGDMGEDATDKIRNSLFAIQVYKPWLLLQFGTTDEESIGQERIESILSVSPATNFGADRLAAVETEIETYGNTNMTITSIAVRYGEVFFILLVNIIISIFVMFMVGMMILSQLLFIIFATFLPVSFVLSMFPGYNSLARKAVIKVFNVIIMRAGLTLVVTITLSLSAMIYSMSSDYPFIMIVFLQIVVFAGVYLKLGDILGMISLQDVSSGRRGNVMRSITRYLLMRRIFGRRYGGQTRRIASSNKDNGGSGDNAGSGSQERQTDVARENRDDALQNDDAVNVRFGKTGEETFTRRKMGTDGRMREQEERRSVYGDVVDTEKNVGNMKEFEAEQEKWAKEAKRREEMYQTAEQLSKGKIRATRDRRELRWRVRDGRADDTISIGANHVTLRKYRGASGIRHAAQRGSIYKDNTGRWRPMQGWDVERDSTRRLGTTYGPRPGVDDISEEEKRERMWRRKDDFMEHSSRERGNSEMEREKSWAQKERETERARMECQIESRNGGTLPGTTEIVKYNGEKRNETARGGTEERGASERREETGQLKEYKKFVLKPDVNRKIPKSRMKRETGTEYRKEAEKDGRK